MLRPVDRRSVRTPRMELCRKSPETSGASRGKSAAPCWSTSDGCGTPSEENMNDAGDSVFVLDM